MTRVYSGGAVRENDRVIVQGSIGKPWAGVLVRFRGNDGMVVPDGKTKPKPVPLHKIRREKPPAPSPSSLTRKPTTEAELRRVPKPRGPARDARYLEWVRSLPCCACKAKAPSHPHHQHPRAKARGMGQKVSDYHVVPLCARDHGAYHDTGSLPALDRRTTLQLFAEVEALLLERWIVMERDRARGGADAR